MDQQAQRESFHYQHYLLFPGETLGTGAYGQVCKAMLDELPCAAKLLHPTLVHHTDTKNQTNLQKFEYKFRFLSKIHHPNIVQYLGVELNRESGLPVLLMELMDESLTHFLEQSMKPLSYYVQVDIIHDITVALGYLHSNDIIHKDLSSNNVLLIGPGYRAKVADFGMSTLTEMYPHMTPLTKCPGIAAYMAPEALQDEPVFSAKLDVFQAGVLMIQIITRKFPAPDQATYRRNDPLSPTGVKMKVSEIERRQNHLSLIPQTHPLLCLVLDCLKDRSKERPTAQQVCQQLFTLKEASQYVQSLQKREGGKTEEDREREREFEMREIEVERMKAEIEKTKTEIGKKVTEVGRREKEVRKWEREIEEREVEIGRRVMEVGRREKEVEARITEIEKREREIEISTKSQQEREQKEQLSRIHQQMENQLREERDQLLNEKCEHIQLPPERDQIINKLSLPFARHVSGPGLSATANCPKHSVVELSDAIGQPCPFRQNATSELPSMDLSPISEVQSADTSEPLTTRRRKKSQTSNRGTEGQLTDVSSAVPTTVSMKSPSKHKMFYTVLSRGHHSGQRQRKVGVQQEGEQSSRRHQQGDSKPGEERDDWIAEDDWINIEHRPLSASSFTCRVSGPGLVATADYPTHVIVELSDVSGQLHSPRYDVTAELCMHSEDKLSIVPTTLSIIEIPLVDSPSPLATTRKWRWSKKRPQTPTSTTATSICQYRVSYTAMSRGQHKLHIRLNSDEVSGSPFNIVVYPNPTQLGTPVRVATGLSYSRGIAINSHGRMVVSNFFGHRVSLLDRRGVEIQTYGIAGDGPDQMRHPTGVAVDSDDNVYVASYHKLQKFSKDGYPIKCVGQRGNKDGEFREPLGVRFHCGHVYVCDKGNNRIQVFDTDLNFIRTFGSPGTGRGEFNWPYDLDFDSEGKAYISDETNRRIQVMDTSGQFVHEFGQEEGEGRLTRPHAVHVVGQSVYVSDEGAGHGCMCNRIAVYQTSGQFITSLGNCGNPYSITSDCNGMIYVPDFSFEGSIHVLQ